MRGDRRAVTVDGWVKMWCEPGHLSDTWQQRRMERVLRKWSQERGISIRNITVDFLFEPFLYIMSLTNTVHFSSIQFVTVRLSALTVSRTSAQTLLQLGGAFVIVIEVRGGRYVVKWFISCSPGTVELVPMNNVMMPFSPLCPLVIIFPFCYLDSFFTLCLNFTFLSFLYSWIIMPSSFLELSQVPCTQVERPHLLAASLRSSNRLLVRAPTPASTVKGSSSQRPIMWE